MEHLLFFLRDKKRLKFLIMCILIGMPILFLVGWGVNYYEALEAEKGTPNEKGGINYYYRENTGADKFPEPAAKLVAMYPNSETTYFNFSTDTQNELDGNINVFTPDSISQVIAFYKKTGKVISEEKTRLEFEKNGQNIVISKENRTDEDPEGTKFSISFYDKATVNKWKQRGY